MSEVSKSLVIFRKKLQVKQLVTINYKQDQYMLLLETSVFYDQLVTILVTINYKQHQHMLFPARIARAGTNKLKCQFYLPTGSHLTKISIRVANLNATLNLNKFGQNDQN